MKDKAEDVIGEFLDEMADEFVAELRSGKFTQEGDDMNHDDRMDTSERWREERYPGDLKEAREAADLWKGRALYWREECDRLRGAVDHE